MREASPLVQYAHPDILNKMRELARARVGGLLATHCVDRARGKLVKTLVLPNGSIVKAVDVEAVRVHQHFFSDKYYVQVELRGGFSRDVAEHLLRDAAQSKKAELVAGIQSAVEEVSAVQYGHEAGFAEGRSEGRSEGFAEGRSQGYQEGWSSGQAEARRNISATIFKQREALMQEQQYNTDLAPSRRRYINNAISIFTDLIRYLSDEGLPSI